MFQRSRKINNSYRSEAKNEPTNKLKNKSYRMRSDVEEWLMCLPLKGKAWEKREREKYLLFVVGGQHALKWAILDFYWRYMCVFRMLSCVWAGGFIRCIQRLTCRDAGALNLNIRCTYYHWSCCSHL